MKKKIKEFLLNAWYEIEHRLKLLCGKPTPMKRFIIVVVIGSFFSIVFLYSLVSSMYNIGKNDAGKEFPTIEHSQQLQLKNDSINLLKQKMYEYEHKQE